MTSSIFPGIEVDRDSDAARVILSLGRHLLLFMFRHGARPPLRGRPRVLLPPRARQQGHGLVVHDVYTTPLTEAVVEAHSGNVLGINGPLRYTHQGVGAGDALATPA